MGVLFFAVLWLLGVPARSRHQHLDYQANTITYRDVLSTIYLGLRVANDKRFEFSLNELGNVATIIWTMVQKHGEGWWIRGDPSGTAPIFVFTFRKSRPERSVPAAR